MRSTKVRSAEAEMWLCSGLTGNHPPRYSAGMDDLQVSWRRLSIPCHTLTDFMDLLQRLIGKYRSEPSAYSPEEFRGNLSSWGPLLFYHLDAEVETLKPDILRRCAF